MWALLYCFMVVMLTSLSPCCLSSDEYPATPPPKAFVPIKEPSAQYPFDLKRPKRSAVQNISSFFYRNFAGEGLRRGYPLFFRFSFCVLAAGGGSYKLASHKGIDPKEEIGLFLIKCFISSLLHPKAEPDEVRLMAKFFSTVSFWQKIQVKSLAQPLMTPDMSMLERHMLLHTVSKLPSNKRREAGPPH